MLGDSEYISLKIIIVSIGIFLLFSLNNCTTDKNGTIKQSLGAIKQEAIANKKSIDSSSIQIQSEIAKIDTLILLLNLNKDYQKVCDMSLDLLNVGVGPYLENVAIKNIIKTDDIKLIKDFEKKESITDLYDSYKSIQDFDILSRNYFQNNYATHLKNNLNKVCNGIKNNSAYEKELFINKLEYYKKMSENRILHYQYCIVQIEDYLFYLNKLKKTK